MSSFLRPEHRSPVKSVAIPSPVKFESVEVEEDLSDLISSLAKVVIKLTIIMMTHVRTCLSQDQAIELEVPVTSGTVSSFLTSSTSDLPDVSAAINNILDDLRYIDYRCRLTGSWILAHMKTIYLDK